MPVFQIQHITKYEYEYPVWESVNFIKLYPRTDNGQEVLSHQIHLHDGEARIETFTDYFGNTTGVFNILGHHQELVIDSILKVRTLAPDRSGYHGGDVSDWETIAGTRLKDLHLLDLSRPEALEQGAEMDEIIRQCYSPDAPPYATVMKSMAFIFDHFQYVKGITSVETTIDEVLAHRSGVCQDFAHDLLQILRTVGIPARYISGYICPNKNGMRGEGATHAWVEAWLPGAGWVGVDPTNNVLVTDTHVTLTAGRNFSDCTPVKGTFKGGASHALSVYVSVGYEDGHISREHNALQMPQISSAQMAIDHAQQQ